MAAVYLIVTTLFSFFPPALPVTRGNMNYSVVVFGVVVIFGVVFYLLKRRQVYTGPIVEREIVIDEDQTSA